MPPTTLKPKIIPPVVMFIFGALFLAVAIKTCISLGLDDSVRWLGGIGVAFVIGGFFGLRNRNSKTITISEQEIVLPIKKRVMTIGKDTVTTIRKHADFSGRSVMIECTNNEHYFVNIRNYCSEERFLELCRSWGYKVS